MFHQKHLSNTRCWIFHFCHLNKWGVCMSYVCVYQYTQNIIKVSCNSRSYRKKLFLWRWDVSQKMSINTRHNLIPLILYRQLISFLMDWHLLINDISHMSERKAHDEMLIDYRVSIISDLFSGKKGGRHYDEVICA